MDKLKFPPNLPLTLFVASTGLGIVFSQVTSFHIQGKKVCIYMVDIRGHDTINLTGDDGQRFIDQFIDYLFTVEPPLHT